VSSDRPARPAESPIGNRGRRGPATAANSSDPLTALDDAVNTEALTDDELRYVAAARAANTLRGYRSDWAEFTSWCSEHGQNPLPAAPSAVTGYLTDLATFGAKVGTMSRRLSAIKFAHALRNLPDPTAHARVVAVWEGVRRTHGAPPDQSAPLMPPELQTVLAACPTTRVWKTKGRPAEPSLAGARDRALLLVGFVAALRRSELAALDVEHVADHANGLVLTLPRSKTNQRGASTELVVLPRAGDTDLCPVTALKAWLELADITTGPVFRPIAKSNRPLPRRLSAGAVNDLVQQAIHRTGIDRAGERDWSAHSLRAGFVTYAHLRGASDRAIAHQTRHRSLATIGTYVRVENAWKDNAAVQLGL
jgi:site-specific recombinase XerD